MVRLYAVHFYQLSSCVGSTFNICLNQSYGIVSWRLSVESTSLRRLLAVLFCVVALGNAEARRPERLCLFESGPNLYSALAAALSSSTAEERRPRAAPATGATHDPVGELATATESHLCIVLLGSHSVLRINTLLLYDLSGVFVDRFNATLCTTNCTFWTNFVY